MDNLVIAEAAEEEYTESLKWYAERSLRAAEGFEVAFEQALDSIAAHPERYPLCDDRHRFFLLKGYPFQIMYRRVSEDRWLVVAVAHLTPSTSIVNRTDRQFDVPWECAAIIVVDGHTTSQSPNNTHPGPFASSALF